jgi:hypothetical protein
LTEALGGVRQTAAAVISPGRAGLRRSMSIGSLMFVAGGFLFALSGRSIERDLSP